MRTKNPARKSAKKSGGSKIKIREKSVLPKAGPKKFSVFHEKAGICENRQNLCLGSLCPLQLDSEACSDICTQTHTHTHARTHARTHIHTETQQGVLEDFRYLGGGLSRDVAAPG